MNLLESLIKIHAPSGGEYRMKEFLIDYTMSNQNTWKTKPMIIQDDHHLHDSLILVFGNPVTAVFGHMDTIGFTVRYQDQLVPIGGPDVKDGYVLTGEDELGPIRCKLKVGENHQLFYEFPRAIRTGTTLVFEPYLKVDGNYIQGPGLDNRLGLYTMLKLAETIENGVLVFSCFEEHGGGSVPIIMRYLCERVKIKYALIADITWVTEGVHPGKGTVVSLRDRNIPRQKFLHQIVNLAEKSSIAFQLEVEGNGSSDGREVHHSPYPVDWCFIGAPESNVHSPNEMVHIDDIQSMINLYQYLLKNL